MKKEIFNDSWYFWKEENSFALVWDLPEKAQLISVPHDAMLEKPAHADSPNGGNTGYRDGGVYTYVKKKFFSEAESHKKFILQFDGVYMNALVYVNGQLAGKNPFGYSTFYVDLNNYLRFGAENEIRVQARAGAMTNSRWYSGAGIYRDVFLLSSENIYIEPDQLKIVTKELETDIATITVSTKLQNTSDATASMYFKAMIYNQLKQVVNEISLPITLFGNESREINTRLSIENPQPWSVETPHLYSCVIQLVTDTGILDEQRENFGIRKLSLNSKTGLKINDQLVKLQGACIHHDSGLLGAATYEDAQRRQILKLKKAGFNAIRMSHQPMAPAMLKVCDEVGMLVMDETFDMWTRCKSDYDYALYFDEWWEKDVEAMIRKDLNHPCVILYSVGNEIPEIATDLGNKINQAIAQKIKSIDDTRFCLASVNGVFAAGPDIDEIVQDISAELVEEGLIAENVNSFMAIMDKHLDKIVTHPKISQALEIVSNASDVVGYNYMTGRYEANTQNYPNRIIVGSETYPPEIARNWDLVKRLPAIIGDFTWTGWDYIGEAGIGIPAYKPGDGGFGAKFPCQLAYTGDFDITGFRRPLSYYREIVFGKKTAPYIAVKNPYENENNLSKTPWVLSDSVSSWSWNVQEEALVDVEVYAPGDLVKLYLNGQLIEEKKSGEHLQFLTEFTVPYQKGTVTVEAFENGQLIGKESLTSAGELSKIKVQAPDYVGAELIYLPIELLDSKGEVLTHSDQILEITVSGAAQLIGFGSGNPKPAYNYLDNITETFNGRAMVILQRRDQGKDIQLKIEANGKSYEEQLSL